MASNEELVRALEGRYDDQFRWLLKELLDELKHLDEKVADVQARIEQAMKPHQQVIRRLCTIPGVEYATACALIAEIGLDMSVFPSAAHVASWAGLCPGNCESAGKPYSGRTRKGDRYLRRLLVQNGWAVGRKKDCYLTAVFYRVAAHRGAKKAAVAVAHKILVIAYYVIRDGVEYREVGGDYFDQRSPERTAKRLAKRLDKIGYAVVPRASLPGLRVTPVLSLAERLERASGCPKCARWGIACIHVKPRTSAASVKLSDGGHSV
jgi:hypothetical protein